MSSSITSPIPVLPPAPFRMPISYYLRLITSEYQGPSPNMLQWLADNLQFIDDVTAALAELLNAYNLSTAVGVQLDVIGNIVGLPRTITTFQPTGIAAAVPVAAGSTYLPGDLVQVNQAGGTAVGGVLQVANVQASPPHGVTVLTVKSPGNNYTAGLTDTTTDIGGGGGSGLTVQITQNVSPIMDDATYRLALQCRIFWNHWNGSISSLTPFWKQVFPGGSIAIKDHGVDFAMPPSTGFNGNVPMTATVTVGGSFSSLIVDMIFNGMIVPRPQGVLYNYQLAVSTLPAFGFDQNSAYVAGFDLGKFI